VKKIATALLNTIQQDNHPLSSERLAAITNYAQKTEADTYNSAISHEDYFQRLAERIYRIQKDYEEKQIAKKQQNITTLTSIDRSAGEQGPPNRIAPQLDYSTSFLTTQIKPGSDNNYQSNLTTTLSGPFDKHRISTDGISRLAIHSNNSNTDVETNGNHIDTTRMKTEEISSNHDAKIQVRF
jgi:hypothetical protein